MRKLNPIIENKKVDDETIMLAEKKLDFVFGKEYLEFIKKYNGGLFEEQLIKFDGDETIVIFCGIDGQKDLLNINDLYQGRLPSDCIAVGMDPGGDLVCLSVNNEIFYWRAENEQQEPSNSDLETLADSFFQFLDVLEEDKDA